MSKRKVVVMECDNPECSFSMEHHRDDPAFGYYLRGVYHDTRGGGPIDVFSCSLDCLAPAVLENRKGGA